MGVSDKRHTPPPLFPQERVSVFIVQDSGWAPGLFWTGMAKRKSPSHTGFEPLAVQCVAISIPLFRPPFIQSSSVICMFDRILIVKETKQYQEKWLQHVQMDTNRLQKQALQYKPKGRRYIGRPRKRWRDQFYFEDQGIRNA